jgi:hypothetical protein
VEEAVWTVELRPSMKRGGGGARVDLPVEGEGDRRMMRCEVMESGRSGSVESSQGQRREGGKQRPALIVVKLRRRGEVMVAVGRKQG